MMSPRRYHAWWAAAVLAVVTACGGGQPAGPASPSGSAPVGLPRVVLVTHATEFRHSSIEAAERVLPGLAREAGIATLELARTADDVRRLLAPSALATVDGIAFVNTTGAPAVPDLPLLLAWIAAGHGFVGVHSASDTYHHRPEYLEMLGNEFQEHGDQATVEAVVEMPAHPAVAHLGARYRVFDEIYRFTVNNRGRVSPLLTLDRYPLDGRARAGEPGDLPLSWAKSHGSGRVFYTALGHRDELWSDAAFQRHILGGLRWTLQR